MRAHSCLPWLPFQTKPLQLTTPAKLPRTFSHWHGPPWPNFSQINLAAVVDTLTTTIDDLFQRLSLHNLTPHFSSSVPVQAPIPAAVISTPFMSTSGLMLTPPPMSTSSPMPTVPPCPTTVQPFPAPLLTPCPIPVAYLPDLRHTRAIVSCNKLFDTVASYSRATTPNDKALEGRNMTLFEIGIEYHGPTMVACKHQPTVFALWTVVDPEESHWNKP